MTSEQLQRMNELVAKSEKTTIKGKKYVMVKERLAAFRAVISDHSITTELLTYDADSCVVRANIADTEGNVIATGIAQEFRNNKASMVNSTSYVENCETSAIGRALANLGVGIDTSYASADEVQNAIAIQEAENAKPSKSKLDDLKTMADKANQDLELMFAYASELQGSEVRTWADITNKSYYKLSEGLVKKLGL